MTAIAKDHKSTTNKITIDVKGAVTLAVAITSFLLVLTYLETGGSGNNNPSESSSTTLIAGFIVAGIISLALFIVIEKRSTSPLVDFGLMLDRRILLANIMIMIVGFSMFIVFQTIPILVQNPQPVGFGGDPISGSKSTATFRSHITRSRTCIRCNNIQVRIHETTHNRYNSERHWFLWNFLFHSTEFLLSTNLGILATGLSLSSVGAQNVIILSTPRQNSGISLGMTTFLRILGSSIAPALAGMFMEQYQYSINVEGVPSSFHHLNRITSYFSLQLYYLSYL